MNTYIISVGSNISPQTNIAWARKLLGQRFALVAESEFFITEPEGFTDQPSFLNGAFAIRTDMTANKLKEELVNIEKRLQRTHKPPLPNKLHKNGPRTIDLDITVHNGIICHHDYSRYWFVKKTVDQLLIHLKKSDNMR